MHLRSLLIAALICPRICFASGNPIIVFSLGGAVLLMIISSVIMLIRARLFIGLIITIAKWIIFVLILLMLNKIPYRNNEFSLTVAIFVVAVICCAIDVVVVKVTSRNEKKQKSGSTR